MMRKLLEESLRFQDEDKEREYEKARSLECLNWLIIQCLHYSIFFAGSLLMEWSLHLLLQFNDYQGKFLTKTQLVAWISMYLFINQIQKKFKSMDEHLANKLRNFTAFLFCAIGNILCTVCILYMEGIGKVCFSVVYLINAFIFESFVLRQWKAMFPFTLIFFAIHLYTFYLKAVENPQEYIIIIVNLFGVFVWVIVRSYTEEKHFREVFSLKSELLKEKNEMHDFYLNIVQYNVKTKESILNTKATKFMHYIECSNFHIFAENTKLKENQDLNLYDIITKKLRYFKRYSLRNPEATAFPHVSEDFQLNLVNSSFSELDENVFEIHFYWKSSESENLTLLIEDKGRRELLREEKMANKCKNIMLRAISHNLKTPLNGILHLILEECAQNPNKLENQLMKMNTLFLQNKINDILDFAKIESGEFQERIEKIEVKSFLENIVEICKPQAVLDQVEINLKLIGELPVIIYGERERMKQILLHLLQNGMKFSKKQQKVYIYAMRTNKLERREIEFGVQDEGEGIEPDLLPKIFKFLNPSSRKQSETEVSGNLHRNPSTSVNSFQEFYEDVTSTSFGLAITQQIAKSIGCPITVKSEPKKGAIFCFRVDFRLLVGSPPASPLKRPIQLFKCPRKKELRDSESEIWHHSSENCLLHTPNIPQGPKRDLRRFSVFTSTNWGINEGHGNTSKLQGQLKNIPEENKGELDRLSTPSPKLIEHLLEELKNEEEKFDSSVSVVHSDGENNVADFRASIQEVGPNSLVKSPYLDIPWNPSKMLNDSQSIFSSFNEISEEFNAIDARMKSLLHYSLLPNPSPVNTQFLSYNSIKPPKRALSVDDNGVNRLVLRKLLEKVGFIVEEAFDGKEAIQNIEDKYRNHCQDMFSICFMDLNMPAMNGIECTKILLKKMNSGKLNKFPILALTAHDSAQLEDKCKSIGFSQFLIKPLKADLLNTILLSYGLA